MPARERLNSRMQEDDFDVIDVVQNRNEAVRIVDQAKIINMYSAAAFRGKFESKITNEDIGNSFKKALIAL